MSAALREVRRRVSATVACPSCEDQVALGAETGQWYRVERARRNTRRRRRKGGPLRPLRQRVRWEHASFDFGVAVCCGAILAEEFDGIRVHGPELVPNAEV